MRMISAGPTGRPATSRSSTQSKPLTLGERAQPGSPSTGFADMAEQQQIAGIDRHAEMVDPAAGGDDRRRDHVAPVDDRRGAVDQQQIDRMAERGANMRLRARRSLSAARLEHERAAERGEPGLGHLAGLVEDALLEARKPGLDQADRERPKRRDAQQRAVLGMADLGRSVRPPLAAPRTG